MQIVEELERDGRCVIEVITELGTRMMTSGRDREEALARVMNVEPEPA